MKLAEIKQQTREIQVHHDSFTVRGLTLAEIIALADRHAQPIASAIAPHMTGDLNNPIPPKNDTALAFDMLNMVAGVAPDLLAEIIAIAADEPEAVNVAAQLPFPSQLEAILAIAELTNLTKAQLMQAITDGVAGPIDDTKMEGSA